MRKQRGSGHRGGSAVIGLAAALSVSVAGCDTSQYAFRVDESISFEAPKARSDVELPVTIRWTDDKPPADIRAEPSDPDASYYAVFVDRSPIGPGASLKSQAEDPEVCETDPKCPDEVFLNERGIFLTAEPVLQLEFLADGRPNDREKDTHEVIIVRMKGTERVGEAAWNQTFYVNR